MEVANGNAPSVPLATRHLLQAEKKKMTRACRPAACLLLLLLLGLNLLAPALASESAFPFDRELILDAAPLPGSKRIPIIEIDGSGAASIELWCASVHGQASVGEGSISIVPGPLQTAPCAPDRQSGDENLLAALAQVTNWRRSGDVLELRGVTTLRFRLMTN
jgi:META domain